MKATNLYARRRRKLKITTNSNYNYLIAANLLDRQFNVPRINKVWVSDITYIQTSNGWMYLTVIIDLYNRKVVVWSMSND